MFSATTEVRGAGAGKRRRYSDGTLGPVTERNSLEGSPYI
ncbi:uncharacterized protein G2W53_009395 [Senna tora]|uniref:Uncharacterized protein n=1 Tax=Senna tora TaxID=362788 RepID=A0A835C7W8_9FABA|nr:uncharacterized protein G2W53_009395 [Senna tora]